MKAIWLVVFFSCISFASLTECINPSQLERFWTLSSHVKSNPYIYDFGSLKFYSLEFYNSTEGLGLSNVSLVEWEKLRSSLSLENSRDTEMVKVKLEAASQAIADAKEAHAISYRYWKNAKDALKEVEYNLENIALFSITFMYLPAFPLLFEAFIAYKAIRLAEVSVYSFYFPFYYSLALSKAADAYENANSAALEAAFLAQSLLDELEHAGAGSPKYSGAAKDPFLYAKSQATGFSSFCERQRRSSDAIVEYFATKPYLPDFSNISFGTYLQITAGDGEYSAVWMLLKIYKELSEAKKAIQSEYLHAEFTAESSLQQLSAKIGELKKEDIMLIGEPAFAADKIVVGTEFSGVAAGLVQAEAQYEKARQKYYEAQKAHSSKMKDYLAIAIKSAKDSEAISANAIYSLSKVHSAAVAAVESEKELAQKAIAEAESKINLSVNSLESSSLSLQSLKALEEAKKAYTQASLEQTLGKKYKAYSSAVGSASKALLLAEGSQIADNSQTVRQAFIQLKDLLNAAEKDGLDVSYQKEQLRELESLFKASSLSLVKEELHDKLLKLLSEQRKEVLLLLEAHYSEIGKDYCSLLADAEFLRQQDAFALQETDPIKPYFDGCRCRFEKAAGKLKEIQEALGKLKAEAQRRIPDFLSFLLSANAKAFELTPPPVLGQAQKSQVTILSSNPSHFSSLAPVHFSAKTSIPLYSSEATEGKLLDAFYKDGQTTIVVPSVSPQQKFIFRFEKEHLPAKKLSQTQKCKKAVPEEAEVELAVSFSATSPLPVLFVQEPTAGPSKEAYAHFSGSSFRLQSTGTPQPQLYGKLERIPAGQHTLTITYYLLEPFKVVKKERSVEKEGKTAKVSYVIEIREITIGCEEATVFLHEPFTASNFSIIPIGPHKVSRQSFVSFAGNTQASFSFALSEGSQSLQFLAAFSVDDVDSAVEEALMQTELQTLLYNKSSQQEVLAQAKLLLQQNKTQEALRLLLQMPAPVSDAMHSEFESESAQISQAILLANESVNRLLLANATARAAQLSSLVFTLSDSQKQAQLLFEQGKTKEAILALRKSYSQFTSTLASLASKTASSAVQALSSLKNPPAQAQSQISESYMLYARGEFLSSFEHAALAAAIIENSEKSEQAKLEEAAEDAELIKAEFVKRKSAVEEKLSQYRQHYSSLSSQTKRKLPIQPSEVQERLEAAQKRIAARQKDPLKAASEANLSLQELLQLEQIIEKALLQLKSTAESSLQVAQLAVGQASESAKEDEITPLKQELSKSEEFFEAGLYADSLASSERVIRTANAIIAKKPQLDIKTIGLGIASILFIGLAAWVFFEGSKKEKEKKQIPKANEPKL
ncbi:MAG: hypothetical protein QXT25_00550 [Candidatus Anstonellaceae archaeon]